MHADIPLGAAVRATTPTAEPPPIDPFHAGERALQTREGSRRHLAEIGSRVIRRAMPEQHQAFFPLLPFIVLGAADAEGQPWATLLAGPPGFVTATDARHLRVDALPAPGDPLAALIRPGAELGGLGIELPTRRRNRVNGRVVAVDEAGFSVEVTQSFGNCPKYIQRRELLPSKGGVSVAPPARESDRLGAAQTALVRGADTFFIASHGAGGFDRLSLNGEGAEKGVDSENAMAAAERSGFDSSRGDLDTGADVSHRGGLPGFVQVDAAGAHLAWPDFIGNRFFNTLGNIALDPRVGLVFPDFDRGGLLHVAGRAEVLWDADARSRVEGAERIVVVTIDRVIHRPAALPWRWRFIDRSPALEGTGIW